MAEAELSISDEQRRRLLALSRRTLETELNGDPETAWTRLAPEFGVLSPPLDQRLPCFVTLFKRKRLRGCIGSTQTDSPLAPGVCRYTLLAAQADPRFAPVVPSEVAELRISISVLGPLSPLRDREDIEIGRHGLVAEKGRHRGLLLAKVATDFGWDGETFIEQTHHKAGLPYPDPQVKLYRFEEVSFEERETRFGIKD